MHFSYMVDKLSSLIDAQQVRQIHIYRFYDARLYTKSNDWRFGHEFIQLDGQLYNLNRVVTFKIVGEVLQLYF